MTGKSAYDKALNTDRLLNLGKVVYEQKCGLMKYIEFRDSDLPQVANLFNMPPTCLSKLTASGSKKNPKDVEEVDNSAIILDDDFPYDAKIKTVTGCTGSGTRFAGIQLGYASLSNYEAESILMPPLGAIGGKLVCETIELDRNTYISAVQPMNQNYVDAIAIKFSDTRIMLIGPKNYKQLQKDWEMNGTSSSLIAINGKTSDNGKILEVVAI